MPATKAVTKRYYPALSEMLTVDDLPEFLHFAENGLNFLLDRIHYKNFQYSKSYRGDAAFYSLDIISKNIGVDLPFGLRLVLNPDKDSTISSFPISLEYQWEMLAFLRSFNLQNFSFTPDAFFQLGLKIFRISEDQVVAQTLNYFIDLDIPQDPEDPENSEPSKFEILIETINVFYPNANLTLPPDEEPTVEMVATLINQNPNIPDSVSQVMFVIYVLDADLSVTKDNLQKFYALMVPDGIEAYVKKLLTPKLRATLKLSAGIEFPNSILKPVTENGTPIPDVKSMFTFGEATFYADTEAGIGSQVELEGNLIPQYNQIGNTGLIIEFTGAKLDLSRKTNIPEADAAGYPVDFMGLYVKHASVRLNNFGSKDPNRVSASITADNLFIGTGGVSGQIALAANGFLYRKFGNFAVELQAFAVNFRQNTIISSDIKGQLTFDKFKINGQPAVIDIEAHYRDDGEFTMSAMLKNTLPKITWPGVMEIEILSLGMGKETRGFYLEVAGKLNLIANIPVIGDQLPKGLEVKKLRIWDNGDLEFKGGALSVPKAFKLSVGPVKLEVTNIGLGSYSKKLHGIERSYRYFSFDGMINTGRAGVNATGNGIKFYYTVDDNDTDKPFDTFISIDRLGIDMTIPGNVSKEQAAFILSGYLSVGTPNPEIPGSNAESEYTGSVTFSLPKLKLAGSAGMRLKPSVPAFVVDIGLELSTPIPLGATGLGIYGFRGLIGQHYQPSKAATTPPLPETASWWDYYKAKDPITKQEGISISKFEDKPGYTVGAGLSIATSFDSGKVFSSKLFLMLGLPGLFMLQGQAGILRRRIGLDDKVDPPFSALVVIEKSSFLANIGVNYRLPEGGGWDGKITALQGTLEMAFFFNNSSGWYVNVGKDKPESARVRATILTLFNGYAYLMISSRGFKAGAGARFDFKKKFLGISVGIGASLDMGGSVSFKPVQIGAFIQVGGFAYFKVWKIGISLSIQIGLAVEAPHPFNISGYIDVKVKVWIVKVKFRLELSWYINNNYGPLLEPMPVLQLPDPARGYLPATATNILSGETFPINYLNYEITGTVGNIPAPGEAGWKYNFNNADAVMQVTIPLDSFIDIELLKPVKPSLAKLGGAANQLPNGYTELLPPQKGRGNQVKHEFQLTGLDVYAWKETGAGIGSWQPYNIYEAVTAIVSENTGPGAINLAGLKQGYWQFSEPNRYNKIRLLSQNMFSYANQSTDASSNLDGLNFRRKDLFCFENVTKQTVVNWIDEPLNTSYPQGTSAMVKAFNFTFKNITGHVKNNVSYGNKTLYIDEDNGSVLITFPKPLTYVKLDFGVNQHNIRIDFIKKSWIKMVFVKFREVDKYLTPAFLSKTPENTSIIYNDLNKPIDKILLTFIKDPALDFDGDLIAGGHFPLPDQYISGTVLPAQHETEADKALMFATVFNRHFTAVEVLDKAYLSLTGAVGQWPLDGNTDRVGNHTGMVTGNPDWVAGFYEQDANQQMGLHPVYSFTSNGDAFLVPFAPALKVETGSFAFEITAIFNPFEAGISTLFYKVDQDPVTGYKKGYALHLYQDTPGNPELAYDSSNLPSFGIWFTCYQGTESSGIKATESYTLDCTTAKLSEKQYKHVLVSVNRSTGKVDIFIDRQLKISADIPAELDLYQAEPATTSLNQLSYFSESVQRRNEENELTQEGLIDEIQLMGDGLSKTIQPVWRPDTTFALVVKTRDMVNGNASAEKSHVFGFRTAGPIGHFQQQSIIYKKLEEQDRAAEFKLANLTHYIDYERSSPDAQSRYDLSKPVFCHDPQIRMFFTRPYINAMYSNWASYQGMPEVKSSLQLQLIDPYGAAVSPELLWEQMPDKTIDFNNLSSLSPDQQILFLMNQAAAADACNANPVTIKKRTKRGAYHLPDLLPNKLYTALFNAIYQPDGEVEQKTEVHKFSFKTSLFASFEEQAGSFILDDSAETPQYAVYPLTVAFTAAEINEELKVLIDDNPDNDPTAVLRYAVKYDRMVYGGLALNNLETVTGTVITLIINVNPEDAADKKILGILIRNPEPFNDPKLPADLLADTVKLSLTPVGGTVIGPEAFIYIHARDTSAVFITNAAMEIPAGQMQLDFRYKLFNGNDYQTDHEDYSSPEITITTDF